MDVTIAVATFGDERWLELARARALLSAHATGAEVIHVHGRTLHEARNTALEQTRTEWIVYLDADDELEPGYLTALTVGTCDLRAPAVRYVRGGRPRAAALPRVAGHDHACTGECLPAGNWLVIGTAARAQLLRDVGGWLDWPLYEDWCLWLRCHLAGATVEAVPGAVYRAHVEPDSRNRAPDRQTKEATHAAIAERHQAPVPC